MPTNELILFNCLLKALTDAKRVHESKYVQFTVTFDNEAELSHAVSQCIRNTLTFKVTGHRLTVWGA